MVVKSIIKSVTVYMEDLDIVDSITDVKNASFSGFIRFCLHKTGLVQEYLDSLKKTK